MVLLAAALTRALRCESGDQVAESRAEIALRHSTFEFTMDGEFAFGIADQEIGGPAHTLFVGVLGQEDPAVAAIGLGVLQHHAHEAEAQFAAHRRVVMTHAVAGATVF
jgi:hypothetical protein